MSERSKGTIAMILATLVWGLAPIFYKLLAEVPPLEVLSHRTLWSFVFFASILMVQRRLGALRAALRAPKSVMTIGAAAVFISLNWFVFILSIQIGRAVEASLGYYIFPLVSVAMGYFLFGETLARLQWFAIFLATLAVVVLTIGLGAAPWISLILASSFGVYGLIKKQLAIGPVVSVTGEVLLLLPLALIWLVGVHFYGWNGLTDRAAGYFGQAWGISLLLMVSGPLTATPLILFSYATKRLTMASTGLMQYLNPTLQFMIAVLIFQEDFTGWHKIAFALIWLVLALYSLKAITQEKSA